MRRAVMLACALAVSGCAFDPGILRYFEISLAGEMSTEAARCASLRWVRGGFEVASLHACGEADRVEDIEQWFQASAEWDIGPGAVSFAVEIYDVAGDLMACGEHQDITRCDGAVGSATWPPRHSPTRPSSRPSSTPSALPPTGSESPTMFGSGSTSPSAS